MQKNFQSQLSAVKGQLGQLDNTTAKTAKGVSGLDSAFGKFGNRLKTGLTLGLGFRLINTAINTITNTFKESISLSLEWEYSMTRMEVVTGTTGDSMVELNGKMVQVEDTLKKMGDNSQFGRAKLGKAFIEFTKQGFSVQEGIQAIIPIQDLALVGMTDLQTATELTAQTLHAFSLEATEAGRLADVFAQSANLSALDVEDFGNAMGYVGAFARQLNYTLEETAGILSFLSNKGLDASKSAVYMRFAFSELANTSAQGQARLDSLGVSFRDVDGEMKDIVTILDELNASIADSGREQDKLGIFVDIFGKRATTAMLSLSEDTEGLNDLILELENSFGVAGAGADKFADTAKGKIDRFNASVEGMKTDTGSVISDAFFEMTEGFEIMIEMQTTFNLNLLEVSRRLSHEKQSIKNINEELRSVGVTYEEWEAHLEKIGRSTESVMFMTEDYWIIQADLVKIKEAEAKLAQDELEAMEGIAMASSEYYDITEDIDDKLGHITEETLLLGKAEDENNRLMNIYKAGIDDILQQKAQGLEMDEVITAELQKYVALYSQLKGKDLLINAEVNMKGQSLQDLETQTRQVIANASNLQMQGLMLSVGIDSQDLMKEAREISQDTGRDMNSVMADLRIDYLLEGMTGGFEDATLAENELRKNLEKLGVSFSALGNIIKGDADFEIGGFSPEQLGYSSDQTKILGDEIKDLQQKAEDSDLDSVRTAVDNYMFALEDGSVDAQTAWTNLQDELATASGENVPQEIEGQITDAMSGIVTSEQVVIDFMQNEFVEGWTTGWNAVIDVTEEATNQILTGMELAVNGAVQALNSLINDYNSLPEELRGSRVNTFHDVSLGRADLANVGSTNDDKVVNLAGNMITDRGDNLGRYNASFDYKQTRATVGQSSSLI